ncbi:MAG: methylmalonyl Co-A mutase-associated GTPase MeaB [Thermotogae bacterium]|nr:methylmalonyl Co-A mutase-associated GTPase MeaB [Thermotogota bacterium]
MDLRKLVERFKEGDERALARLITYVENDWHTDEIFRHLYKYTGKAYRVGITGPPGAGKSTLVDRLAVSLKKRGFKPAIVAVDPSSPFTGGAVLGDRLRMTKAMESGIYIRSMASRGSLGGIAEATGAVADLLDAFGYDMVLIETVGVGQSEVDIVKTADTVIVVLVPESGDAIQAMKAGLMEIAHIFVVNKADREGVDRFVRELEAIISLSNRDWKPPVIKTVALRGEGIEELTDALLKHREFRLSRMDEIKQQRLIDRVEQILTRRFLKSIHEDHALSRRVKEALERKRTPYEVAKAIQEAMERECKGG